MGRKSNLKKSRKCERVFNIDGTETILLNDKSVSILQEQLENFKRTFGRDPIGDEPIFFDPEKTDKPTKINLERLNEIIVSQLRDSGASESYIYAFKKTGRIVTEENEHLLTKAEYKEWEDAAREYDNAQGN